MIIEWFQDRCVQKTNAPYLLAIWLEQLALPELCQEERLEIVDQLKHALSLTLNRQNAPPVLVIATL
jgi:hypothetical protein